MTPKVGERASEARDRDRRVLPSILDRLLDDDPDQPLDPPRSADQLHRALRDAIRRDVEAFFNTRRSAVPMLEEFEDLEGTILDYGVPDFVGKNLASPRRRQEFLRELEALLRRHEPRFKTLSVVPLGNADTAQRSLRFRIDAVVFAEPAPENLQFNSRLEPISRSFSVSL